MAERILHHEAVYACAGIEYGENKHSFKHDGEVIPDGHHSLATHTAGKNVGYPYSKSRSATRAIEQSLLANSLGKRMHPRRCDRESPATDGCGRSVRRLAHHSRRAVDREVGSRLKHASGNRGHNSNHRFGNHRAIADHTRFGLAPNEL